ncbi:uncharacterized protein LOC127651336 [Xyrauchen texanus]|uniref:uncharacterized protein LOC127651336 n=1 Tax=Xyrauchen texanus TaxID=154827 RepID=UPI002241EAD0|nr:uncharacterized protein LOC127651336 [Xyrauchen texanus]
MSAILRSLKRKVAVHQIAVKQRKEERCSVLHAANLEENYAQKTQFRFYGHLTAYLSSIYGHRCGVFQNMLIEEVEGAKKSQQQNAYLINVTMHKTNQAFGPAQMSLEPEEYEWCQRFLKIRNELVGGPDARFFFFTSTPNPCKNLNSYFQAAWAEMNLPGCPTFTDIRSSIATHARNAHTADDRLKISRFMCHDTKIADRFYAINLNPRQALEHRRLFETALEGPELSPVKQEPKRKHAGRKAAKPRKRAREEESPADSPRSQSSESSASSEGEDVEAESHTDSDMEEQAEPGTSATQIQASPRRMQQRAMVILSPLKKKSSPFKAKVSKSFTPEGLAKASEARERVKAVLKLRSSFCRK